MEKMLAGLGAGGGGTEGIGGIPELNDLMKMLGGSGDDPELVCCMF